MRVVQVYFKIFFILLLLVNICVYDILSRLIHINNKKEEETSIVDATPGFSY